MMDVSNITGKANISPIYIFGSDFSKIGKFENFSLTFRLDNFLKGAQFRGFSINWSGSISLNGICVIQESS
jgi:hypothetical protein